MNSLTPTVRKVFNGEILKPPVGSCRNGCFQLMEVTSVEIFLFNPGLVQKVLWAVMWKWRSVSSGCGYIIRVRIQSFVIAASYFLVLFAYFKTDTPFILGSFSLSARHSSESSPAHHLFYNEAHHSCILWAPIWVHRIFPQWGTRPKASWLFFLQLEPQLPSTGYSVHVFERPSKPTVIACINYVHLPSSLSVDWGSVCFSSPFHAVCLHYQAHFRLSLVSSKGREGSTFESGFISLNRDENGPVAPWFGRVITGKKEKKNKKNYWMYSIPQSASESKSTVFCICNPTTALLFVCSIEKCVATVCHPWY